MADANRFNRHKSEVADGGAEFLAKMREADKKAAELHLEKERRDHEMEQLHEQLWRGTEDSQFYKREAATSPWSMRSSICARNWTNSAH